MSEKYSVLIDGIYEYDIIYDVDGHNKICALYRSNEVQWSEHIRGEFCFSITNNGNGTKFNRPISKLNYAEYEQLNILFIFDKFRRNKINSDIRIQFEKNSNLINCDMKTSKEIALASIKSQIKSLEKQKERLEYEILAKGEIVFSQLTSGTWIINKHTGAYYQWMTNTPSLSTIARNGEWSSVDNWSIIENFRLAKIDEINQHIDFMKSKGRTFESYNIGLFQKSNQLEPKPVNPAEFFMVTLKQGIGSKKYHESYDVAVKEATRLAKKEKKQAYVMGVVASIDVEVEEIINTNITEWRNKQ